MPSVVLVVEDNHATRAMYSAGLSGYGFQVTEARGIKQAKMLLEGGMNPKVVVLDLNLHDGQGTQLVHYIREELNRDDMKIVVTTGSPVDAWTVFEMGADVFLNKPIDLPSLIQIIRQAAK